MWLWHCSFCICLFFSLHLFRLSPPRDLSRQIRLVCCAISPSLKLKQLLEQHLIFLVVVLQKSLTLVNSDFMATLHFPGSTESSLPALTLHPHDVAFHVFFTILNQSQICRNYVSHSNLTSGKQSQSKCERLCEKVRYWTRNRNAFRKSHITWDTWSGPFIIQIGLLHLFVKEKKNNNVVALA